jgi:hypothetical protein
VHGPEALTCQCQESYFVLCFDPLTALGPLKSGTVDPVERACRASAYFHAQVLGTAKSQEVNDQMAIQEPTSAPASAPTPAFAPAPAPVERASVTEKGRYNFRAAAVVGFIVGVVDIFIAARFLGKLFGASSQSAFANFIYQVSAPVVAPFAGIFGNSGSSTNTFETASLVAIVVYAVIGWGLVVLIRIVTAPHGTKPASA